MRGDKEQTSGVGAGRYRGLIGSVCCLLPAVAIAIGLTGGIAAERGIMMRSGEAFRAFKDVRQVLLDKTGTITAGKPSVTEVGLIEGIEEKEFLKLVASAEASSEHPLGRAIVEYANDKNIELSSVRDFQAHTGRGVVAEVDGQRVIVGTARFLQEQGINTAALEKWRIDLERTGQDGGAGSLRWRGVGNGRHRGYH